MVVDVSGLQGWLALAAVAISVGTFIYNWFTSGSKQNSVELTEHKAHVENELRQIKATDDEQNKAIQKIESEMEHLPDLKSVHGLDMKIEQLSGAMGMLSESLKAVERTAHRIENYLLEAKPK